VSRAIATSDRALVSAAQRLVVLADSSKWGTVGISSIASLADANTVVTDAGLPEDAREVLRDTVGELVEVEVR